MPGRRQKSVSRPRAIKWEAMPDPVRSGTWQVMELWDDEPVAGVIGMTEAGAKRYAAERNRALAGSEESGQ